jgi:hypothetical protein
MPRDFTPDEWAEFNAQYEQAIVDIRNEASLYTHDPQFNQEIRAVNGQNNHSPPVEPETDPEDIWETSNRLRHIHQQAQALLLPPWTFLGAVLGIVLAATGPHVTLPARIGYKGSLNLLVALVGPSGGGKTTSVAAARDYLNQQQIPIHELGTGQGVTSGYTRAPGPKEPEPVQFNDTVLWLSDEIGSLTAHTGMKGSNLLPILKQAYSGSQLGARYAGRDNRRAVLAHRYRAAFLVGVQPAYAAVILNDLEGGFPQRWIWLPTHDPNVPDEPPERPPPWAWRGSQRLNAHGPVEGDEEVPLQGEYQLSLLELAQQQMVRARQQRLKLAGDPMTSHRLLSQAKVAAALALLHERARIETWEWETAQLIMERSDLTRLACEAAIRKAKDAQLIGEANTEQRKAEYLEQQRSARIAQWAKRTLLRKANPDDDGWVTWRVLTQAVNGDDRIHLPAVLEKLMEVGEVELREGFQGGSGTNRARSYRATTRSK